MCSGCWFMQMFPVSSGWHFWNYEGSRNGAAATISSFGKCAKMKAVTEICQDAKLWIERSIHSSSWAVLAQISGQGTLSQMWVGGDQHVHSLVQSGPQWKPLAAPRWGRISTLVLRCSINMQIIATVEHLKRCECTEHNKTQHQRCQSSRWGSFNWIQRPQYN